MQSNPGKLVSAACARTKLGKTWIFLIKLGKSRKLHGSEQHARRQCAWPLRARKSAVDRRCLRHAASSPVCSHEVACKCVRCEWERATGEPRRPAPRGRRHPARGGAAQVAALRVLPAAVQPERLRPRTWSRRQHTCDGLVWTAHACTAASTKKAQSPSIATTAARGAARCADATTSA